MSTAVLERPTITITPLEMPSPYQRLAEAIERGCALHPQGFGAVYHEGQTCALGAAAEGVGWRFTPYEGCGVLTTFPDTSTRSVFGDCGFAEPSGPIVTNPIAGIPMELVSTIVYLNDVARWSREEIADWVRGLEDEL